MKRIKILKGGVLTNQAEFADAEGAAWLAQEIANGSFGKAERWVREGDEDISGALETRQVDSPEGAYTEYKLPAEFSVVEENIDAEIAEREAVAYGKACQEFGAELIAWVHSVNEAKALTIEQFQAILNDATLAQIERCLWNGSVKTAKILIQAMQPGLFSQEEKDAILAKIDAFLSAHGKL